jgi:NAD(P)-dependent dehydrogenase (short-subunit alcohol dehydrogenase family)
VKACGSCHHALVTDARRVSVVTGAGSGIGAAAAVGLAGRGHEVVLVGRRPDKLAHTAARVRSVSGREPAAFTADFASLADVRRLAAELREACPRIDVLANNAGALGGLRTTTVDGYELIMQVDHLAPYLLTHELLAPLRAAGAARVIGTASRAEAVGALDPDDLSGDRLPVYSRWVAYGSAKQANVLFAAEASRRLAGTGIVATSFHPGVVRTGFGSTSLSFTIGKLVPFLYATPERGADTLVHLATHGDGREYPGGFFAGRRLRRPSPAATDPDLARRLWDASAAAVGVSPDW